MTTILQVLQQRDIMYSMKYSYLYMLQNLMLVTNFKI